ncbi:hypothetical protein ACET3X_000144 [Alternaria dauci]|uniref:Uncharacterized protein n=1 Tax=Alternaria dauci TaxID=48095 RepID=A0ABR3UU38_9PLEO
MIGVKPLTCGLIAAVAPIVAAGNPFCKGGIPAVVAAVLTGHNPAETFCSSAYPLPKITSTRTTSTSIVTTTVATISPTTTVATVTDTITPSTETVTVTSATVTESVSTTVDTTTFTQYVEATTTSTSTFYTISIIQKRDADNQLVERTNPKAASQWASVQKQAKSFVGSVCTCLETPVTVSATTTPLTTTSVMATSSVEVTATATATATATSTVSATSTTTTTLSVTATSSTTITTTTTLVETVTAVAQYRGPICNVPNMQAGSGGCSPNCFCDPRTPGGQQYGLCDTATGCNQPACSSDLDCGPGQACADYSCPQGAVCVSYTGCASSFVPSQEPAKRGLVGGVKRKVQGERRAQAVDAKKLLECRWEGLMPEQCPA